MDFRVSDLAPSPASAAVAERLIGLLPAWFGRPEENADYVRSARELPGFVAEDGDEPIGLLLYRRHFPESAELHLLAVHPARHRGGVGRALVAASEDALRADGCRLLQVKTLGAAHPDLGYAATRAFYQAVGYLPLEEDTDRWAGTPCLVLVKVLGPAG